MFPLIITIGGEAGFGIMSSALTLAKLATRSGYELFSYSEYPSIIRGGHNVVQLAISPEPVRAPYQHIDILIALNQDTITRHADALTSTSFVIHDSEQKLDFSALPRTATRIPVPLNQIARTIGGTIIMRNSVALGALVALTGANLKTLTTLLDEEFIKKNPDLAERNKKTAHAGYDVVREHFSKFITPRLAPRRPAPKKLVVTGNEAAALGAIAAGLQFASVYPMTPTSAILQTLAPLQEQYGFIYEQPEDEIAALTMAIGASFGGARSLVATAGGGFCLMTEAYGLAAMTETPVVIIVGMRGGPATGLPTWTEQADLQFVLHAHQGEFTRIVLAPGDTTEAFEMTREAFNLADRYQTPVIVLMDKHLCESQESSVPFTTGRYRIDRGSLYKSAKLTPPYARYALTQSGISPRAFPGSGHHILANSDEHTEYGFSSEDATNRENMMKKRLQKETVCAKNDRPNPTIYGPKNAKLTLICWGSTKGALLEAIQDIPHVNVLHLTWLSPFPTAFVKKILSRSKHVATVELNQTGQLHALIAEKTGVQIKDFIRKSDGRPFFVEELRQRINDLLRSYGLNPKHPTAHNRRA